MHKTFPTLYKLNSRGKTQEWEIKAVDLVLGASYVVTYGQLGGSMQTTTVDVACGKNLGKANETTAFEQACLEAESKWKKQTDKGYRTAILTSQCGSIFTSNPKQYLPMLAKSYKDYAHKITFPCYGQKKLDGLRCVAFLDMGKLKLFSRRGKEFKAVDHIKQALAPLFAKYPDVILDGELFTTKANFQKIISAIKRDTPSPDSHMIEYWVYDHFDDADFADRTVFVKDAIDSLNHPKIRAVDTFIINDAEAVTASHKRATKDGFEGIMLRNMLGEYQNDKRSDNLQKVKEFLDAEFVVVDAEENKGKQAGQCTFICVNPDGKRFGVKPMGSDFERSQYWQNRHNYIGKELTVRFFEYSDDGIPRFPVGVIFRDYE